MHIASKSLNKSSTIIYKGSVNNVEWKEEKNNENKMINLKKGEEEHEKRREP